jgi:hypothetical protein
MQAQEARPMFNLALSERETHLQALISGLSGPTKEQE